MSTDGGISRIPGGFGGYGRGPESEPQEERLEPNGNNLQKSYSNRDNTQTKCVRVELVLGVTIGGFLLRFFLSIIGWKNLYHKWRFTGAALIDCR